MKCANVRTLVYKMQVRLRESLWSMIMRTRVFLVSVSKSVLSINGLSFVSARPALQPCVSVFMVQGIREIATAVSTLSIRLPGPIFQMQFVLDEI